MAYGGNELNTFSVVGSTSVVGAGWSAGMGPRARLSDARRAQDFRVRRYTKLHKKSYGQEMVAQQQARKRLQRGGGEKSKKRNTSIEALFAIRALNQPRRSFLSLRVARGKRAFCREPGWQSLCIATWRGNLQPSHTSMTSTSIDAASLFSKDSKAAEHRPAATLCPALQRCTAPYLTARFSRCARRRVYQKYDIVQKLVRGSCQRSRNHTHATPLLPRDCC